MPTSSRKIRLGFIGAGFIGQIAHLENYAQLDNCQLHAIADLRPNLLNQVADKFGIENRYGSHKELLADEQIDAVVVVTARAHTADVVRDCLLAGKHVFSEKPMAGNSEIASALVQLAEQHGLVYCVGYMKRCDAGVVKAKSIFDELMSQNTLGKLLQVSAQCYMGNSYCKAAGYIHGDEARPDMVSEANFAPSFLSDNNKSLFARYVNVHSHLLNFIRHFLGTKPSVEYFNTLSPLAHVCVMRANEQLVVLETGEVEQKDWQERCTFIFEQGQLIVTLPPALLRNVPATIELQKNAEVSQRTQFQVEWSWAFKNQAATFIDSVQNGNINNLICAKEALVDIELAEDIWKKLSN
ncbi:Gfo/Idh/MocA family protein [Pseudoalteromonas luteoviolacea]|uniref:Gfo/Idh/MocA family protein n=1 Tax=Pseudoalteromonas luteoviolacea TaxID=43657 RepID=UPI001B36A3CA|nr:Gfo/Idh/MocA family oxidoreductase [Pseudoalteromonas luteoviolacea]MBQ4836985.1 Gfo/Idh/MocA family oxidoreductase [Pseudoalteromonas luteoviolacea]